MSFTWKPVDDGEYNEVSTIVNGHEISVFSDRLGQRWHYAIDGEAIVGPYESKGEAQQASINEAMSMS